MIERKGLVDRFFLNCKSSKYTLWGKQFYVIKLRASIENSRISNGDV